MGKNAIPFAPFGAPKTEVAPATYKFTATTTGRQFTARHLSPEELKAVRVQAGPKAMEQGKERSHMLCALLVSRSLVEPKLSVADAFELQEKAPGLYSEIVQGVGNNAIEESRRVAAVLEQRLRARISGQQKRGR